MKQSKACIELSSTTQTEINLPFIYVAKNIVSANGEKKKFAKD